MCYAITKENYSARSGLKAALGTGSASTSLVLQPPLGSGTLHILNAVRVFPLSLDRPRIEIKGLRPRVHCLVRVFLIQLVRS